MPPSHKIVFCKCLKIMLTVSLFDFCLTIIFINKYRTNVIACAKHFVGDGGTELGLMEGDTVSSFEDLEKIHMKPYLGCLAYGVSTIMPSYTSWNGTRMHGHRFLLTDILKEKLGFKVLKPLISRFSLRSIHFSRI